MQIKLNFGSEALVLPASVISFIDRASKNEIKLILALASDKTLLNNFDSKIATISKQLKINENALHSALAFWKGTGIIDLIDAENDSTELENETQTTDTNENFSESNEVYIDLNLTTKEKKQKSIKRHNNELPAYTSDEIESLTKKYAEINSLVDSCSAIMQKRLTRIDIEKLIAFVDYFMFPYDFILQLVAYYAKKGKTTFAYLEPIAWSLFEDNIKTTEQLEEFLKEREKYDSFESKVRKLIGATSRQLSTTEKFMLSKWSKDFAYTIEVIEKAFDITINQIGEAKLPYMDKIICSWAEQGAKTLSGVTELIEKEKAEREKNKTNTRSNTNTSVNLNANSNSILNTSFNTNDFFEAALKRSYGEDK